MMYHVSSIKRSALTLVEVLFSIGVIMIGLLGLLSVMPLAGRRAQDAVSLSVGAEMSDSIAKQVRIRRWLGNGNLSNMPLTGVASETVVFNTATNQLQRTDSSGMITTLTGICIDPLYYAVQGGNSVSFGSYDNSLFPYYATSHDPLLNPADSTSIWPDPAPRLARVGWAGTSAELARTIIESVNDLVVDRPDDRSAPARLIGLSSGSTPYGRRIPSGEFTWMATVTPSQNSRFANLSIVVMRQRVVDIDFPTAALTPPVTPEMNGISERTAYVTLASGFSGGAGGIVHLTASRTTSSQLAPNDWIMLSRRLPDSTEAHRWYRVVAVDAEPDEFFAASNTELETSLVPLPTPDTGVNRTTEELWRRRVTLDGPDWEFDFTTGQTADNTFDDNTYATLVEGVVSVTERLVPWTDL